MKSGPKGILSLWFVIVVSVNATAQYTIKATIGQKLVFVADSLRTRTTLKVNNGIIKIAGDRYLWANPNSVQNNVVVGSNAGNLTMLGIENTFYGVGAGTSNAGNNAGAGSENTFIGTHSGTVNQTGYRNTFIGRRSGFSNKSGNENTLAGTNAGYTNSTGNFNTVVGYDAGYFLATGSSNTFLGRVAGSNISSGSNNTFLGTGAGSLVSASGAGNVYIGNLVGPATLSVANNKLSIHNAQSATPLVHGDFNTKQLVVNGILGVSTAKVPSNVLDINNVNRDLTGFRLFVQGGIVTDGDVIEKTGWADYVFEPGYKLMKLQEVETVIKTKGHLPNMPSGKQIETQGAELGEITVLRQEKIEELTLYAIEQRKVMASQSFSIEKQHQELAHLKKEILRLLHDIKTK